MDDTGNPLVVLGQIGAVTEPIRAPPGPPNWLAVVRGGRYPTVPRKRLDGIVAHLIY
jgi:hypothetical protein